MYFFVFVISVIIVKTNARLAPFITPCKADDNKCIQSSAQAALPYIVQGIPELGVPSADPIEIESIRNDGNNLKLGFSNIKVYGGKSCQIYNILRDTEKNTIKFDVDCNLLGVGHYDLRGNILFIEAYGDGEFNIKTDKIKYSIEMKLKTIEKNGKKYWKIAGFDYKYKLIEKVHINLTNLFGGDDSKAKIFREVLDISWREIIGEVGDPIYRQMLAKYLEVLKKFFLAVPCDELELV